MFPVICQIGPIPVYSYGLMLAIAVFVSSHLLARDAERMGIRPDVVYDLVFRVVIGGIIGARIFYVFINLDVFIGAPLEIVMLQKGGLAWQGSFAGGLLAGLVFIRRYKLPLRPLLDTAAPYIALGQSIGRIGCLLNGCCFGKAAAWGLYFPVWEQRLVPTQIFMSLGQLGIFIVLRWLQTRQMPPGRVFAAYVLLSSAERFGIEFLRADHQLYGGLSIFQYVCLALFAAALAVNARMGTGRRE